jgi:hypothetical protein
LSEEQVSKIHPALSMNMQVFDNALRLNRVSRMWLVQLIREVAVRPVIRRGQSQFWPAQPLFLL